MAFMKIVTSDTSPATREVLPAGNMEHIWQIFRNIRTCRSELGLRASHLQTLQAMLSILRPGKGLVVFASNRTLCERAGFIDERTLRRHIARLEACGLLFRQDSPNRKRYRISDPSDGCSEAYGLNLQPMENAASIFQEQAQQIEQSRQRGKFLRKRLLRLLFDLEQSDPQSGVLSSFRQALRRKLVPLDYEEMISRTADLLNIGASQPMQVPAEHNAETDRLTANDGQSVRQLSMSEKKELDLEETTDTKEPSSHIGESLQPTASLLRKVKAVCTEAFSYTKDQPQNWIALRSHARMLAPMMGIAPKAFDAARETLGCEGATLTLLLVLQLQPKIRNLQAYFHSITIGKRSAGFDPIRLLDQIAT
jgi:replication initiation protein RepC